MAVMVERIFLSVFESQSVFFMIIHTPQISMSFVSYCSHVDVMFFQHNISTYLFNEVFMKVYLSSCRAQSKSPKSDRKNIGLPEQREFMEQRSATDCLTSMITDCKKVFRIPEDFLTKCSSSSSYMEAGEPAPLSLLGAGPDYQTHIDSCIQGLLKVCCSCSS